ncbi:MAG: hypothetical protein ABSH29_23375 [Acidimicrobiales bacterium]|jgi:hypothetical protein
MRLRHIARPLTMVVTQWCRVLIVGADHTSLACHQLGGPGLPDIGTVDEVARLALLARRLGGRIILSDVSPALRSLLDLAGLPVEVEWEAEGGEEPLGVERGEEHLHPGDLPS